MSKPQSIYASRSRKRGYHDAAAIQKSWTRMDVLRAYLTPDGDLVVIDMNDNLYTTVGEAVELYPPETVETQIVAPAEVPDTEFGPKWQAARKRIAAGLAALDLSEKDRGWALSAFEQVAATALRGVELLRTHTGPDWREAIGLTEESED